MNQRLEIKTFGFVRRRGESESKRSEPESDNAYIFKHIAACAIPSASRNMCVLLCSRHFSTRLPRYYAHWKSNCIHACTHKGEIVSAAAYLGLWLRRRGGGRVWRWRPARTPAPPAANKLNFNTDAGAARRYLRPAESKSTTENTKSLAARNIRARYVPMAKLQSCVSRGKGWTQNVCAVRYNHQEIASVPHRTMLTFPYVLLYDALVCFLVNRLNRQQESTIVGSKIENGSYKNAFQRMFKI